MPSRLDNLLDDLVHASQGKRRLPVVQPRDAEQICGLFHEQIDRGTARRAELVAAGGHTIACGPGCSACCANIPAVHMGESLTIARYLARPENDPTRVAFLTRFDVWRAALGDLVDRWIVASAAADVEVGKRLAIEAWKRNVMCAFLDDGKCSIYPVRPAVCREHHAVDTAAGCTIDATVEVRQATYAPLDDYMNKIRPVLLALHDALSPDAHGARPLCQAVHDDLANL